MGVSQHPDAREREENDRQTEAKERLEAKRQQKEERERLAAEQREPAENERQDAECIRREEEKPVRGRRLQEWLENVRRESEQKQQLAAEGREREEKEQLARHREHEPQSEPSSSVASVISSPPIITTPSVAEEPLVPGSDHLSTSSIDWIQQAGRYADGKDYAKALCLYEKAAEAGNANARQRRDWPQAAIDNGARSRLKSYQL